MSFERIVKDNENYLHEGEKKRKRGDYIDPEGTSRKHYNFTSFRLMKKPHSSDIKLMKYTLQNWFVLKYVETVSFLIFFLPNFRRT
jgi:hypothetical protein